MIDGIVTIGIPRALLYYKYADLWDNFFNELGLDIIHSPDTNNEILENGKQLSIDESCLSMKIFMGHVNYLVGKADYILIPRIECLKKKEKLCTNFSAIYDIVNNLFNIKILNYNVNVDNGQTEKRAFLKMGRELGKKRSEILQAYAKAKRIVKRKQKHRSIKQYHLMMNSQKPKILLVSHPYNTYDQLIGRPIIKYLSDLEVDIIYADLYDNEQVKDEYKTISKKIYWTYNKQLLEAIVHFQDYVDGIILLTVFPCGPDSLTNEMCIRKISKPVTNIIIDELTGEAGLHTRIESFVDIIKQQKKGNDYGTTNH